MYEAAQYKLHAVLTSALTVWSAFMRKKGIVPQLEWYTGLVLLEALPDTLDISTLYYLAHIYM
jgi:hypothetical protein